MPVTWPYLLLIGWLVGQAKLMSTLKISLTCCLIFFFKWMYLTLSGQSKFHDVVFQKCEQVPCSGWLSKLHQVKKNFRYFLLARFLLIRQKFGRIVIVDPHLWEIFAKLLSHAPFLFYLYLLFHARKYQTVHMTVVLYCGNGFFGDVTGFLAQVPSTKLPHHCTHPE